MTKYLLATICLALAILVFGTDQARAQRRGPVRYEPPAGPTLSPYLLFSRRPTGIYDNYNAFIRPRFELRQTLRVQNNELRQLDRNLQAVRGEVRTLSEVQDASVLPTGVGSSYQNYSHFYPSARGR